MICSRRRSESSIPSVLASLAPTMASRGGEFTAGGLTGGALSGAETVGGVSTVEDGAAVGTRSEEHTSELQSLMRISYAVFCLKKKKTNAKIHIYKDNKNE